MHTHATDNLSTRCLTQHPACIPDVVQIAVSSRFFLQPPYTGKDRQLSIRPRRDIVQATRWLEYLQGPSRSSLAVTGSSYRMGLFTIHGPWLVLFLSAAKFPLHFACTFPTISRAASHPIDGSSTQHLLPLTQPPASSHHQPRSSPPFSTESSHLPPCTAPTNQGPPSPVC